MFVDPTGHIIVELLTMLIVTFAAAATGTIVGGVMGGLMALAQGEDFWTGFKIGALSGFIAGLGAGLGAGLISGTLGYGLVQTIFGIAIPVATGFVGGFYQSMATQMAFNNGEWDKGMAIANGFFVGAVNLLGAYASVSLGFDAVSLNRFGLEIVGGFAYGSIFTSLGTAFDLILNKLRSKNV